MRVGGRERLKKEFITAGLTMDIVLCHDICAKPMYRYTLICCQPPTAGAGGSIMSTAGTYRPYTRSHTQRNVSAVNCIAATTL